MFKKLFSIFSGNSENLKKEIEELSVKLLSLEKDLEQSQNESSSYKSALEIEQNKVFSLESKITELASNDFASIETSLKSEISSLKKQLDETKNQNAELTSTLTKSNAKMAEMVSTSANSNVQVNQVNQELENVKKELGFYKEKYGEIKDDKTTREKKKSLVVDDSVILRNLQKGILESAGFQVILAKNGLEGKNNIEKHNPDIIITDIEMPEMDGITLTKWIKDTPEYKKTPVVMITSHSSDEDKKRCMESGADAFIIKDQFNQKSFLELIGKLLPN
ncbi:MAG: response regulator [Cyanobacteriota bacterium]